MAVYTEAVIYRLYRFINFKIANTKLASVARNEMSPFIYSQVIFIFCNSVNPKDERKAINSNAHVIKRTDAVENPREFCKYKTCEKF